MTRKHAAFALHFTGFLLMGISLLATIQFIRGELPNPILLLLHTTLQQTSTIGAVFQWFANIYLWLGAVVVYLGCGVLSSWMFNDLSLIAEHGWTEYRQQQRIAHAEYERMAAIEIAQAKRRRLRAIAQDKKKTSNFGAVIFGIMVGWIIFH